MEIKKTGIIRRIDDFGRITIPKELRKELRASDYTPFELSISEIDGRKVLMAVPYSVVDSTVKTLVHTIQKKLPFSGCQVIIADNTFAYGSDNNSNNACYGITFFEQVYFKKESITDKFENNTFHAIPLMREKEVIAALILYGEKDAVMENTPTAKNYATIIEAIL